MTKRKEEKEAFWCILRGLQWNQRTSYSARHISRAKVTKGRIAIVFLATIIPLNHCKIQKY